MIAFLLDVGLNHGLGHFNRCLNLAKIFLKKNHECLFIVFKESEHYKFPKIKNLKITIISNNLKKNLNNVKKILSKKKINTLIIDTYKINNIPNFKHIEIIHINDFKKIKKNVNITINPGLIDFKYLKKIKSRHPEAYYGPRYSLIRENFLTFRKKALNKNRIVKKMYLFFLELLQTQFCITIEF